MKKVLIVDDEYLVRLGLRTSFHWALHGFEIVGEASNGEEALRFSLSRPLEEREIVLITGVMAREVARYAGS